MKQLSVIILFLFPFFSNAQWSISSDTNMVICNDANDQQDVRIVSDGKGGAIMTWVDKRVDGQNGDIYAQRIDSNGTVQWTNNGRPVVVDIGFDQAGVRMIEDGKGGAILVWKDLRNGNSDIYIQRINSSGTPLWTTNGKAVVIKPSHQENPIIAADGSSGAIIAWQDSSGTSWDIFAQHIDSNGAQLWNSNGAAICTDAGNQVNPKIVSDANGGAVIVWQDKRNLLDYDVYAQRINSAGVVQWTANGVVICNEAGTQNNPKIDGDGAGNFLIAWQDKRNIVDYNIYAQAVNQSGVVQWAANGVAVCSESGNQSSIDLVSDASVTFIVWKDFRNGTDNNIYAQKINWSGSALWTLDGIAVIANSFDELNPNLVLDGSGGVFIVWQDSTNVNYDDVYGQRISSGGTLLWNSDGVAICTATNDQLGPKQISDGKGNMIVVWSDFRNSADFDIYAQRVYGIGSLFLAVDEPVIYSESVSVFPNPFSENATLRITNWNELTNEKLELKIYDLLGREVFKQQILNPKSEILNPNLPGGIYFYKLKNEKEIIGNGKLVVSD